METRALIEDLAAAATPIRPLGAPWRRTALWLAISIPYVGLLVSIHLAGIDAATRIDLHLAVEQTAILLTALTAAIAAFSSVVPGRDRRIGLLPLLPLTLWLASLGEGCLHDWLMLGSGGLQLRADWHCAQLAVMLGVLPAIVMVVMLRRGAPLLPHVTLALGALAVAALVNFGLRIFHIGDISIMVLVWHVGGTALLSAFAGALSRYVLNWRSVLARSRRYAH